MTYRVMILIDARHGLKHFDGVLIEHIHAQSSQVLQASMALDFTFETEKAEHTYCCQGCRDISTTAVVQAMQVLSSGR